MARWSKPKAQAEIKLPPLTTEKDLATNWHKTNTDDAKPEQPWTVTWDTSRKPDAFNTARHKTEGEAMDCARRFLRLGCVVYSIKDGSGSEVMNESEIYERFKPASADVASLP
jgi:hypothetical protein